MVRLDVDASHLTLSQPYAAAAAAAATAAAATAAAAAAAVSSEFEIETRTLQGKWTQQNALRLCRITRRAHTSASRTQGLTSRSAA